MTFKVHKEAVSDLLWYQLNRLMKLPSLEPFRLVGGTALSLLIGHRLSVDIDLFSDSSYRSLDFRTIYTELQNEFDYVSEEEWSNKTMGNTCFIGINKDKRVKLDMFYTDPFVFPMLLTEKVRLASLEEIIAMKLDLICRGGRKKDFWDIHALLEKYKLPEMLTCYQKRYPYSFPSEEILHKLTNFEYADLDPDPICLHGKYWELIKLDLEEMVEEYGKLP